MTDFFKKNFSRIPIPRVSFRNSSSRECLKGKNYWIQTDDKNETKRDTEVSPSLRYQQKGTAARSTEAPGPVRQYQSELKRDGRMDRMVDKCCEDTFWRGRDIHPSQIWQRQSEWESIIKAQVRTLMFVQSLPFCLQMLMLLAMIVYGAIQSLCWCKLEVMVWSHQKVMLF